MQKSINKDILLSFTFENCIVFNKFIEKKNYYLHWYNSLLDITLSAYICRAKCIFLAEIAQTWHAAKPSSDVWLISSFHTQPFKENLGQPKWNCLFQNGGPYFKMHLASQYHF